MATGRKNCLEIEVYGSPRLGRRSTWRTSTSCGSTRVREAAYAGARGCWSPRPDHPYVAAWWPPGHILGWDHTFTSQAADFLAAIGSGEQPSPSFEDGLAVQRVLGAIEESAGRTGARVAPAADPAS